MGSTVFWHPRPLAAPSTAHATSQVLPLGLGCLNTVDPTPLVSVSNYYIVLVPANSGPSMHLIREIWFLQRLTLLYKSGVWQLYTMLIPFILISALKYTDSLLALKYIVSALSSCNRVSWILQHVICSAFYIQEIKHRIGIHSVHLMRYNIVVLI